MWFYWSFVWKTLLGPRPKLHHDLHFFCLCKPAVYTCNLAVYTCNPAVYTCKPAVYTWKVLNFRFTAPILITVLDTVEVTPFFSKNFPLVLKLPVNRQFTVKQWFRTCKVVIYSKAAVYTCKPLLYKNKFERKVLPPQCPAKLWEEQL